MKLINRSDFAKHCDVSRAAISGAISRGKIDLIGEGRSAKVNLTAPKTVEYLNSCSDKKANGIDNKRSTTYRKRANKKKTEPNDKKGDGKSGAGGLFVNFDQVDLNTLTAGQADRLKKIEEIKSKRQKRLADRKELVEKNIVRQLFAKIYTIDVNEHLTVGDKLAPDIAAICKIDDPAIIILINEAIKKEMYKILDHRKRLIDEFLTEIEAEALET